MTQDYIGRTLILLPLATWWLASLCSGGRLSTPTKLRPIWFLMMMMMIAVIIRWLTIAFCSRTVTLMDAINIHDEYSVSCLHTNQFNCLSLWAYRRGRMLPSHNSIDPVNDQLCKVMIDQQLVSARMERHTTSYWAALDGSAMQPDDLARDEFT